MPKLPVIVAYMFPTYHPSWMSSSPTQWCLGCDRTFQFAPYTPHHNHLDCLHPTMGTHLLCLESIRVMPQLPIWARRFRVPSSIHGINLTFFLKKFFENLAQHEIFFHKFTTFVVQCTLSFCG